MTKIENIDDFIAWLKSLPADTNIGGTCRNCPLAQYSSCMVGNITYHAENQLSQDLPKWARKFVQAWPWAGGTAQAAIDNAEYIKRDVS